MTNTEAVTLAGGRVVDPASGLDEVGDLTIADGRIAEITTRRHEESGPRSAGRTLDCRGLLVVPGLIDSHSHIFAHVSKVGAPVEEAHLRRGVVAVADAGTAGASTFEAFRRYVVEPTRMRVLSFLNVSALGLIDFRFGELLNPATLVVDDVVEVAARCPSVVRGLKIRLSTDVVGDRCLPLLAEAVTAGDRAGLPLMVHIGETAAPLGEILRLLRPGDLVAHCYTGKDHGILEDGKVTDAVWEARGRGVLFECAHGKSNFSYAVAEPAIDQGFLPDLVCSDTSYRNWNGPVFDLVTTMSKLVSLGVRFTDVLARTTEAPARLLGLWDEGYGRLEVGGPAHVTVLATADGEQSLPDASGGARPVRRFEPRFAWLAGEAVDLVAWRGENPSES
jgi:dihydroorotase